MECRICQSGHADFSFQANGCDLYRCARCGFTQVAELPDDAAVGCVYSAGYFSHSKYHDAGCLERENRRRLALVRQFSGGRGGRVLDAGCGVGDFIGCGKQQFEMSGIDLSEFAVEIARRRNPDLAGRIGAGSIEELALPAAHFDAVCLWDVIEHLRDPLSVCRRVMGCLRPGGHLFLSTPRMDSLAARALKRYWAFMTPPEHLSFFSRQSLHTLFEETLHGEIVHYRSKGKWANCGFILYKIKRVAPALVPGWMIEAFGNAFLARLAVYVPTCDIQYLVVRKPR